MKRTLFGLTATAILAGSASALPTFNEFEPNPIGRDPKTQSVELLGTALGAFDLWILSIENDGINGTVDRATNVVGSFDANGLAVVSIGDLENPSNTVILTSEFTGSVRDDLDTDDDGVLETDALGIIFDAVGISDGDDDNSTLYASGLGGTNILYNGQYEPLNVFRDSHTGEWYQTVTVDYGDPNEHIGVFSASGGPELDASSFSFDPTATTFGAANPAIPEPASLALLGLGGLCVMRRRRG